ncbi:MAG TPA: hypothetical protein PLG92_08480 [Piscinibacter sp.]|jgi:hypothetical protein|uniref:hypothetical protein n=1 Tax=Piscinibacter sp. TaxID=1903157 RepID=UPI001B722B46|nr:hypothetical protein [Piscinibacter sp.]MBP5990478.1 hypothetical protein [Piscinibacter sp.]MBP6027739.1 hypothetical protein [Piscinibacter sp.]HNJ83583.1 hypothetical protein [Piscinibacter sp.]HNK18392.1 hypothetical protein [Piscinibacter sp.]
MRSHPRNSPEAATRLVALAMIADGHLSEGEQTLIDAVRRSWPLVRQRITPQALDA